MISLNTHRLTQIDRVSFFLIKNGYICKFYVIDLNFYVIIGDFYVSKLCYKKEEAQFGQIQGAINRGF